MRKGTKIVMRLLPPRMQIAFWYWVYAVRYGPISNVLVCCWFLKMAFKALRGKIRVIDSQPSVSNGGYRYFNLTLSPKPVSSRYDPRMWD